MDRLAQIEAILAEIEKLDAESGGQFRQIEDREARDVVSRVMRKLAKSKKATA